MMREILNIFVPGHAKTKGSVDAFKTQPDRSGHRRTYVRQSVQGSSEWAALVEYAATKAWAGRPTRTGVPIRVNLAYYLPCTTGKLIARGSGDIDKLERNILDALTRAGVYGDDAQVVGVVHEKMSAVDGPLNPGARIGVQIVVWEEVPTRGIPASIVIVDEAVNWL